MLRLRVLSDLHLEFSDFAPPPAHCDAVVLAGDIHQGVAGLTWARRVFADLPIIYVPGNHEYYGRDWDRLAGQMARVAREQDIHLLDRGAITIAGVRILGCTLWTDFDLFGSERRDDSMTAVGRTLFDYRYIESQGQRIIPEQTRQRHLVDRAWLEEQLDPAPGCDWRATVVVTHMVPSQKSTAERYKALPVSAGFASHLDAVVARANLWIHGHTHDSYDYALNGCRVVCNPRGYQKPGRRFENNRFDPGLVVAI
jgi:predicted phosphodiesterase